MKKTVSDNAKKTSVKKQPTSILDSLTSQTLDHNTSHEKTNDKYKPTFFDEYYNLRYQDRIPMTVEGIKLLADDLYIWAQDDESLIAEEFYLLKGIDAKTFHNWMKRCPELKQAYAATKDIIAGRRERGALTRKYDAGTVRWTMPAYSKKYKKLEEWKAELGKKDDDKDTGTKVVIMEKYRDE